MQDFPKRVAGVLWGRRAGLLLLLLVVVVTCRLVLWSEKGELKKHVTMLMTVSVT